MDRIPIVGSIVHYQGPQSDRCIAAIVTMVHTENLVALTEFPHPGAAYDYPRDLRRVHQDEGRTRLQARSWHWPEHDPEAGKMVFPAPVLPIVRQGRSTPEHYSDRDEMFDKRNVSWRYYEMGDVWIMVQEDGTIDKNSPRSYQRLVFDLGPLTDKPG